MSEPRPNIASPVWTGPERRTGSERLGELHSASTTPTVQEPEPPKRHLKPVWILLLFLVPCLALTFYYGQVVVPGSDDPDSFSPSTSYALVLLLINLDLIGFVVLLLLLSRNLIKTYFERRHRLIGSGFRTKLVAAFIGFSLIPTVLLAFVASGLVNKAVDVWFSDQIDRVMRDSYEVAKMQHAGHITLAVNSARHVTRTTCGPLEEWGHYLASAGATLFGPGPWYCCQYRVLNGLVCGAVLYAFSLHRHGRTSAHHWS